MDAKTQAQFEARAKIIKAMAHPTRLFIVDQLAKADEKCVCELTEMIGADLAVLKSAGIIQDEKRGSQVYYRLRVPCATQFFGCVESVMKCNVEQQRDLVT